jgi:hypothetical protein
MRQLKVLGAVAAVAIVVSAAFGRTTHAVGPGDASATNRYLTLQQRLARATAKQLHTEDGELAKLVVTTRATCAGAVGATTAGSGMAADMFAQELLGAVQVAYAWPTRTATIRFSRSAQELRWSRASVTSIVHGYAARLRSLAELPQPDICGDARAWSASPSHAPASGTVNFDRAYDRAALASSVGPQQVASSLERFAGRSERAALQREAGGSQSQRGVAGQRRLLVWTVSKLSEVIGVGGSAK